MHLKHLDVLLPSFISEIEKDAGVKDALKAGTKSIATALKSIGDGAKSLGDRANNATLRVASKVPPKMIVQGNALMKAISGHQP